RRADREVAKPRDGQQPTPSCHTDRGHNGLQTEGRRTHGGVRALAFLSAGPRNAAAKPQRSPVVVGGPSYYPDSDPWTRPDHLNSTRERAMQQVLFEIPFPGVPDGIPIYGFGMMLFLAFVICTVLASRRAASEGIHPQHVQDMAIWMFVGGLAGARLTFL